MNIILDNYTPLISYLSPASIPQIVAHIQDYLLKHPILSVETVAEIIVQSLQEHPELLNGEAIPISADSEQSIKAYIDALPFLDTYTKAEINALLLGKQDTLTFDQAPTPGSSNPVTSSGIIAALSALQTALETQIGLKADSASTYTKTQVDTLLEDKADADDVYSKNTIDAKLLEVDTEIDNVNDALDEQSQQIDNVVTVITSTTNNSGHAISSGEYFIANGAKYKASATIDTGATWSDKSISVSDHDLINALNSKFTWHTIKSNIENGDTTRMTGYNEYLVCLYNSSNIIIATGYYPEAFGTIALTLKFITSNNDQIEAYYNTSTWTITSGYKAALYGR